MRYRLIHGRAINSPTGDRRGGTLCPFCKGRGVRQTVREALNIVCATHDQRGTSPVFNHDAELWPSIWLRRVLPMSSTFRPNDPQQGDLSPRGLHHILRGVHISRRQAFQHLTIFSAVSLSLFKSC
jgi:hypothetical protein